MSYSQYPYRSAAAYITVAEHMSIEAEGLVSHALVRPRVFVQRTTMPNE